MTLYEALQKATSEEDVKAAYIRALGLKNVQRNLIDIQTKEVWFEAKSGSRRSVYFMFTQLLNYVWVALRDERHKGLTPLVEFEWWSSFALPPDRPFLWYNIRAWLDMQPAVRNRQQTKTE